eukprot:TRINITY_DN7548_c0_g1_i1.p1 TRINITY_DN7548_c0_g1~~TRINITY_DN7548_c0_g1_i1.p1  ORF type:complete len:1237 (+),score=289.09 TRINITY_DN7548_c0_g1_i1:154-3711(+)
MVARGNFAPKLEEVPEAETFAWAAGGRRLASGVPRAATALRREPRIIVHYGSKVAGSPDLTRQSAESLRSRGGVRSVRALGHVGMAVVHCEDEAALEQLLGDLAGDPDIELAVADGVVFAADAAENETDDEVIINASGANESTPTPMPTVAPTPLAARVRPNDPLYSKLWGLERIEAPEAWSSFVGTGASGVVVAIIDSGIDYTHEDLHHRMWTNAGEIPDNGLDDDGNGYVDDVHGVNFASGTGDPMDDNKHGTHCAGTVAGAGNNSLGVTGVAWTGVQLMALKFLDADGSGTISDAISALDYAVAHGAWITSNSWGGEQSTPSLRIALERAEAAGMLFVVAAGNDGRNIDEVPYYPACYKTDSIVTVASTQEQGGLSGFSNYGENSVHLAAPGSRILSSTPGNAYEYLSGTSMATPAVSGLAALLWMYRPDLSVKQIKRILMDSVTRENYLDSSTISGGEINAKHALSIAHRLAPNIPPTHSPKAIAFMDNDVAQNHIGGVVTIVASFDESDIDYYKVSFLSAAGYPLGEIGIVNASGAVTLELNVTPGTQIPKYAESIAVVAGNASGDNEPWRSGSVGEVVKVAVVDYALPQSLPSEITFGCDADPRKNYVAGTVRMKRASDEATIQFYNIYWNNRGVRGALLDRVQAIGYQQATCAAGSCEKIQQEEVHSGVRFSRSNYDNDEKALITLTGPARIVITQFSTELGYDYLRVASKVISGSPKLPMEIQLPHGPSDIVWFSDASATGAGWSFLVQQSNAMAELKIETQAFGDALEVVPAYGIFEMHSSTLGALVDLYGHQAPPASLAPLSLKFQDSNTLRWPGFVRGTARLLLPEKLYRDGCYGEQFGGEMYYRVDFAAADNSVLGGGLIATKKELLSQCDTSGTSDAECWAKIKIPLMVLPKGATRLVARAGNFFGQSATFAAVDLQAADVIMAGLPPPKVAGSSSASAGFWSLRGSQLALGGPSSSSSAAAAAALPLLSLEKAQAAEVLREAPIASLPVAVEAAAAPARFGAVPQPREDPWLVRSARETFAATASLAPTPAAAAAGGRVRCSVRLDGWRAELSDGLKPLRAGERREAVVVGRALAAALGDAEELRIEVRVLRVDFLSPTSTAVFFEVKPQLAPASARARAWRLLDSVEARLALLTAGGRATRSFERSLEDQGSKTVGEPVRARFSGASRGD